MEQRFRCLPPVAEYPNSSVRSDARAPLPLQTALRSIGITKRRSKQLDSICLIREQRTTGCQELAFNARPFVLCGLPLRRPPSTQLIHRRRNGKFFLHVVAHPDFGLPYGQDRLIPIWIATLAVKQKSRTVRFASAIEMLNFFHFPTDGRYYNRMTEGFQRIFAATIFFGTAEQCNGKPLFDWSRFHFFDNGQLWFDRGKSGPTTNATHAENIVTLSESFFTEITQHPIPVEREAVALLANSPGALDFYVWLAWKCWSVRSEVACVPLFGYHGLASQLGCGDYSSGRFFRRKLSAWLRRIATIWPECPARFSDDGTSLVVRSPIKATPVRSA